jgi:hypothetical protein
VFIIAVGRPKSGKTELATVLMEGATIPSEIMNPGRPKPLLRMAVDTHQGTSGKQFHAGFYPNPEQRHRQYIWDFYRVHQPNAAFHRAVIFCLEESLPAYRVKFAAEIERGAMLVPLKLHDSEWGSFGYSAMMSGGMAEASGKGKPAWRMLMDNILAELGPNASPKRVLAELEKARVDSRVIGALRSQMQVMDQFSSRGEHLVDWVQEGIPMLMLLESRYLSPDIILPLEIAAMNALIRPCRNGTDPHRWVIADEMLLQLISPIVGQFMLEAASQQRHRPVSFFFSGQRVSDFPRGLSAAATMYIQLATMSYDEWKAATSQWGVLHGIPFQQVMDLKTGQALIGAMLATAPEYMSRAQMVNLRPSLLWSAGESLNVA